MLRPVIMIGCGGSGQKAVRYVRDSVRRHLEHKGWEGGFPKSWQFIGIDIWRNQEDPSIPFLPNNDYLSISLAFNNYQGLNDALGAKFSPEVNLAAFKDLQGWRPNPSQVSTPLQEVFFSRAVDRLFGIVALQGSVQKRIDFAFSQCTAGGPELAEVSQTLGVNVHSGDSIGGPIVIVVGSMAGGTGSGIMLDVIDLVRRTHIDGALPVLVAFTPDIFGAIKTDEMTANSAAFMAEMMSAYWDDEHSDRALIPAKVAVHTRGPHSIYLIGRKNLDGLDLINSSNVYQAVAKTLSAIVASPLVQTSFHNHLNCEFQSRARANPGGYGFQPSQIKGVASSFGSATISIGRDRFRDYLKKLLHRSVIEHLADGYESVATSVLGDASKTMSGSARVAELTHRNIDRFVSDCGLSECELELNEIGGRLFSNESTAPGITATKEDFDEMFREELQQWRADIFRKTLIATNEYAASLSMPVVLSLLKLCREMLVTKSLLFREYEGKDAVKGMYSTPNNFVREHLAIALEAVATGLLPNIEASIQQSLSRINSMTKPEDGKPPLIDGWPKNDGVVPTSFAPSPVEFFLEDYSTWPELAKTLISQSIGDSTGLPLDPVEAARFLLIRGGYGANSGDKEVVPLIWAGSHTASPQWEPGQQVVVKICDDFETMTDRIDNWLKRPATELYNVLTEGLSSYLNGAHHRTGAAIADHQQRLSTFHQKLKLALMQSKPLVEIDQVMNREVHPMPLRYVTITQGFPFGKAHPAREATEQVIQEFLSDARNVDWAFSSGETESVLITNFLEYPVHPSVIKSFTQPLTTAVATIEPERLRSSFWQWRRARILENFIPLPDSLRIAVIRGFAVGRVLGVMTVKPSGQNQISTSSGVFDFPKHLLTETDQNNFLPVLLEAMILAFADAPTKGKAAFNAYGALADYGTGGGMAAGFEIDGEVARIMSTGEYGLVKVLDPLRSTALLTDPDGRVSNAIKYLDGNIARYDSLEILPLSNKSWRNREGSVDPVDTLTLEMLGDLRKAYVQVKEAFVKFEKSSLTGTAGGVA